jgi:hypothetical protein
LWIALGEADLVLECLPLDLVLPLLADLVAETAPGERLDLVLLPDPDPLDVLLADVESPLLLACSDDLGLLLPLSGPLDILLVGGDRLALSLDLSLDRLPDGLLDLDLLLSLSSALSRPRS